jgi:2-methylcitrate dehydratase
LTLEERIAQRVAAMSYEDVDVDLLHVLKRNILDSYAGICGSLADTAMLENFDRLAVDPVAAGDVPVWGIDRRAGLADAVFMNAILGRRSDLLDTYLSPNGMGGCHPSDNVALALTLARHLSSGGRELIESVLVAFTSSAAFSTYYDPESANYDHDAAAPFYTALTIGRALGLESEELARAQRIAGMLGLDTNQAALGQVTDWKHCTYASGAMRAVQAVKLARAGFDAPPEIYEGAAGVDRFFPHADEFFHPPVDLSRIIFKRWPALVFCQTPIDVALDLAGQLPEGAAIASVHVETFALALRNGGGESAARPTSRAGRTHSIPYCVATALLKPIEYTDFDEPRSRDPDVLALLDKVRVSEDPVLTAAYPASSPCVITLTLSDGTTLSARREVPVGDPTDPLSDDQLSDKLRQYFAFARSQAEQDEIIERLWDLESQTDLDWLIAPLERRRL